MTGALFYAANPLVFERTFAGHFAYLLGYALLPVAVRAIADDVSDRRISARPALWLTALAALTAHFVWLVGVVILVAGFIALLARRGPLWSTAWLGVNGLAILACNAYLLPSSGAQQRGVRVDLHDLAVYRTVGDSHLGRLVNVLGLYGFWRREPQLPSQVIRGWPFILAAILLVTAIGFASALRDRARRVLALIGITQGVVGVVLAFGDQGPFGALYRFAFIHVPGFAIMREPQKFSGLLAVTYALGFGWGTRRLLESARAGRRRTAGLASCALLPIAFTPTLVYGLAGQLRPVHYPASWRVADRLMGSGPGKVLFLPWHEYMSFPFTGRIVANPADGVVRRSVIAGDNVELRTIQSLSRTVRSSYLEFLFAHGQELCSFGTLVADLGIQYVFVAKTVDFEAYEAWLARQPDLVRAYEGPDVILYRNLRWSGLGAVAPRVEMVADWGEVVAKANSGTLSSVTSSRREAPGTIATGPCNVSTATIYASPIRQTSPVTYRIPQGTRGVVHLAEPYDLSWRLGRNRSKNLVGGTLGVEATGSATTVRFNRWGTIRTGYLVSGASFVLIFVLTARSRSRGSNGPRLR